MSLTMTDLLQEVDDALRREKAEKFWKENGPYVIGGAIFLVIMTGIFATWNNYQQKAHMRQTDTLLMALEAQDPLTALQTSTKDMKGGYKALAELQEAGMQVQAKKTDAAITLYNQLSADSGAPSIWRDLATLMAVRLQWNGQMDQTQAKAMFDRVKPLTEKANPWHLQADIQAAMIAGDSLKDTKTALALLADPINDATAPASLRDRARALDHLYGATAPTVTPVSAPATPKAKD